METTGRTFLKAVSWQLLGLISMTALAFVHSGSITESLSLAASASATGFAFYFVHERLWSKIRWGRTFP